MELEPIDETVPENPRNGVALELSFINANTGLTPEGVSQQSGYHHYLKGKDSSKRRNGVPHYKELRYPAVWEGVDLELSASLNGMKMNWVLNEPSRVSSIRLHWAGLTSSTEFPATPGAYQTSLNGTSDAFVIKKGFAFYRQASVE